MTKLFISNISFKRSETQLKQAFEDFGTVHSCKIILDKETNKPRGFGFVEMDDTNALKAIKGLNGVDFGGRDLNVKIAEDRTRA